MLNLLLILLLLIPQPTEHRVTFYWPGEPGGSITADGTRITDPDTQRIIAVSRVTERVIPMHSIVWIEDSGLYIVRDRTARWLDKKWPQGTVDICVSKPRGGNKNHKVWVIWRTRWN